MQSLSTPSWMPKMALTTDASSSFLKVMSIWRGVFVASILIARGGGASSVGSLGWTVILVSENVTLSPTGSFVATPASFAEMISQVPSSFVSCAVAFLANRPIRTKLATEIERRITGSLKLGTGQDDGTTINLASTLGQDQSLPGNLFQILDAADINCRWLVRRLLAQMSNSNHETAKIISRLPQPADETQYITHH